MLAGKAGFLGRVVEMQVQVVGLYTYFESRAYRIWGQTWCNMWEKESEDSKVSTEDHSAIRVWKPHCAGEAPYAAHLTTALGRFLQMQAGMRLER